MQVTVEPKDGFTVVHLRGEFDALSAQEFQGAIERLLEQDSDQVVVNLRVWVVNASARCGETPTRHSMRWRKHGRRATDTTIHARAGAPRETPRRVEHMHAASTLLPASSSLNRLSRLESPERAADTSDCASICSTFSSMRLNASMAPVLLLFGLLSVED